MPLVLLRVTTTRAVNADTGSVKWVTNYRYLGESVREDVRELPALVMTAIGKLPAKSLVQALEHKATPCGLGISAQYWYTNKLVRCDVTLEVYDPPALKGDVKDIL